MTSYEELSDKHEQEQSPEDGLKHAIEGAWQRYEAHRVPGEEDKHPTLTLFTEPNERGRYSKLTFGPSGYRGLTELEGIGTKSFIRHRPPTGRERNVAVEEYGDGKVHAFERGVLVKTGAGELTDDQRRRFDVGPSGSVAFPRVDRDYFVELTELLGQATPEKPKSRLSGALGRAAAKVAGLRR